MSVMKKSKEKENNPFILRYYNMKYGGNELRVRLLSYAGKQKLIISELNAAIFIKYKSRVHLFRCNNIHHS